MTTKVVSSHTCPTCLEFQLPTQSLLSYALLGATKMAEPEDEPPSVLLPCSICSRTFKPESLQKHIKACEKQLTKKRKVFDSSKQRIQGTELAEFLPIILREKKSEKVPVKKQESKWKEKHLEFVRAIRAARGVEVESFKNVPAPRSNHEKCPHCDRNFGPKAFDRHVEWCKEQKARIPKSPGSLQAKERLEARTKYRAPPLAKSKRTLTREKYAKGSRHTQEMSPMGSRSIMTFSKMSPNNPHESKLTDVNTKIQSMRNKPKVSASSPSCILPGGNIQIKRREPSPSPNKKPMRSKNIGKTSVLKEKSEDKHRENTFTSSNIAKLQTTNEKVAREGKSHATDKSSSEEVYDPYVSAERQMMELLSQGDYVQPTAQHVPLTSTESSPVFPSFDSSHKSAFVRYSPPTLSHIPDDSLIPSALIAEFEDLFIAESKKHCFSVDNSINADDQNKNIPLSLASMGLNFSNNNTDVTQPNRKPSKIRAKMENASLSLQRSVSLMNYENDSKIEIEANNFIQTDEDNIPLPVPSEFSSISFSSPESRRTFSSKSHLEKGDADKRVYGDNCIYKIDNSTELENKSKCHSIGGKFSADSAYGSLKRRSPGNQLPEKHVDGGEGEPMGVMSSSSSESSLPPLCSVQILKSEASNPSSSPTPSLAVSASPVTQSVPRMSKFCHECGSKYPVSLAKFCCECGVRRLAM